MRTANGWFQLKSRKEITMANSRIRGWVPVFGPDPEPDNSWVGWVFFIGFILLMLSSCGG